LGLHSELIKATEDASDRKRPAGGAAPEAQEARRPRCWV